jgi:hypothetical protein
MKFSPSSLLGPNVPFSTLLLHILNLCSSLRARDKISLLYKETGKIIGFYILTLDFKMEDRKINDCELKCSIHSPNLIYS